MAEPTKQIAPSNAARPVAERLIGTAAEVVMLGISIGFDAVESVVEFAAKVANDFDAFTGALEEWWQ